MKPRVIAVDIESVPGRIVLANLCWQCDGTGYLNGGICGLCRDGYMLTEAGEAIRQILGLRWYVNEAPWAQNVVEKL